MDSSEQTGILLTGNEIRRLNNGRNYPLTILLPNGIREISTSLKCWRAQGMPMIVMKRIHPIMMCINAVYQPPNKSQIILQKMERQPELVLSLITCWPNGQSTSVPSLKHCKPHGIPTTVIHNRRPPTKYPNAAIRPPKTSQTIFPNKFME